MIFPAILSLMVFVGADALYDWSLYLFHRWSRFER
jgi:hypothetical protein